MSDSHVHRWLLGAPRHDQSAHGVCACGAERDFDGGYEERLGEVGGAWRSYDPGIMRAIREQRRAIERAIVA